MCTLPETSPGQVDRGVSPMGIDRLPGGTRWIAIAGTDDVWRFDADAAVPDLVALDDHPPVGVWIPEVGAGG